MGKEEWERKPIFIGHKTIAVIDIYEPHEHDMLGLYRAFYNEDLSEEQLEAKDVNFKKAAEEMINHFHGRECIQFINDLMVVCAEYIMEDWKSRSSGRVQEYKKSLVEDIKKVVEKY